jgi:hypothetical protein
MSSTVATGRASAGSREETLAKVPFFAQAGPDLKAAIAATSTVVRLNAGDRLAVKQMFLLFEPYMRMVIHRRINGSLRAKFDSADVVQSVWADFVAGMQKSKWTFENIDQLRAFLVKMTRNRFVDRLWRQVIKLCWNHFVSPAFNSPC